MPGQISEKLPRISVLTPCFNAVATIAEAANSVQSQTYPDIEHLILDGGSNDGTIALLKHVPGPRVISEPDAGSHDAMNKGVRRSTGEIIGFLNSDDFYAPGILHDVGRAFAKDPQLDVVVTGTVVFTENADRERDILVARDHLRDGGFWLAELAYGAPGFNGRFYRRRLFERLSGFEISYDFSADRDFLTRVALSGAKTLTLSRFGYFYRSHPRSRTLDASRRSIIAFAQEHMLEATHFAKAAQAEDQQRHFRAWYAFSGVKLCYLELRRCRPAAAILAAWRLSRADCLWPSRLILAFRLRRAVRNAEAQSTLRYRDQFGRSIG